CLNCSYTMRTNQEVQSAILAIFHTLVDAAKELGAEIVKALLSAMGAGGVGAVAGPLNESSRPVPCPKCGAERRWEDGRWRPSLRARLAYASVRVGGGGGMLGRSLGGSRE